MATYCSTFIKNFSDLTQPLLELTKKNTGFRWTAQHEKSFNDVKSALISSTYMSYFDKPRKRNWLPMLLLWTICNFIATWRQSWRVKTGSLYQQSPDRFRKKIFADGTWSPGYRVGHRASSLILVRWEIHPHNRLQTGRDDSQQSCFITARPHWTLVLVYTGLWIWNQICKGNWQPLRLSFATYQWAYCKHKSFGPSCWWICQLFGKPRCAEINDISRNSRRDQEWPHTTLRMLATVIGTNDWPTVSHATTNLLT